MADASFPPSDGPQSPRHPAGSRLLATLRSIEAEQGPVGLAPRERPYPTHLRAFPTSEATRLCPICAWEDSARRDDLHVDISDMVNGHSTDTLADLVHRYSTPAGRLLAHVAGCMADAPAAAYLDRHSRAYLGNMLTDVLQGLQEDLTKGAEYLQTVEDALATETDTAKVVNSYLLAAKVRDSRAKTRIALLKVLGDMEASQRTLSEVRDLTARLQHHTVQGMVAKPAQLPESEMRQQSIVALLRERDAQGQKHVSPAGTVDNAQWTGDDDPLA